MNKYTFEYSSSSEDSENDYNENDYHGLYNSAEEYNRDLITYLYSINNDYESTVNDPKMREIEEKILTLNLMKNRKPIPKSKDDMVIKKN